MLSNRLYIIVRLLGHVSFGKQTNSQTNAVIASFPVQIIHSSLPHLLAQRQQLLVHLPLRGRRDASLRVGQLLAVAQLQ
jgi:hypothetical protein